MINKNQLLQMWDHMRQTHGIALRVIAALPADQLDSHPIPKMRTPKELVIHMYDQSVKDLFEGVARGQLIMNEENEKKYATTIKTRDELIQFCRNTWNTAEKTLNSITDAQLTAMVKTPFGADMPGFVLAGAANDELLHHRGQLYAYVRAMGGEPPEMWDFEHNEAGLQPKAKATA